MVDLNYKVSQDHLPRLIQNQLGGEGTEFALVAVNSSGVVTTLGSTLFRPFLEKWIPEKVQKEAVAVVATRHQNELVEFLGLPATSSKPGPTATPQTAFSSGRKGKGSSSPTASRVGPSRLSLAVPMDEESQDDDNAADAGGSQPRKRGKVVFIEEKSKSKKRRAPGRDILPGPQQQQYHLKEEESDPDIDLVMVGEEEEWVDVKSNQGRLEGTDFEQIIEHSLDEEDYITVEQLSPLVISNAEAVSRFLDCRFIQLQQLDCKTVAKCWIKVVEPKKQSHSPYNKGDLTRPSWWPRNVQHREPDHLLKQDRITLLKTIIRSDLVPISKLRAATDESPQLLSCKKALLAEVYDVIELELRYRDGMLDEGYIREIRASPAAYKPPKKSKSRKSSTAKASGSDDSQASDSDRPSPEMMIEGSNISPEPRFQGKGKGKETTTSESEGYHSTTRNRRSSIQKSSVNPLRRKSTPGPTHGMRSSMRIPTPQPAPRATSVDYGLSGSPATNPSPMTLYTSPALIPGQLNFSSPIGHMAWNAPSPPMAIPSSSTIPADIAFRRGSTNAIPFMHNYTFDASEVLQSGYSGQPLGSVPSISPDTPMTEPQSQFPPFPPTDDTMTMNAFAPYGFSMDFSTMNPEFQNLPPYHH